MGSSIIMAVLAMAPTVAAPDEPPAPSSSATSPAAPATATPAPAPAPAPAAAPAEGPVSPTPDGLPLAESPRAPGAEAANALAPVESPRSPGSAVPTAVEAPPEDPSDWNEPATTTTTRVLVRRHYYAPPPPPPAPSRRRPFISGYGGISIRGTTTSRHPSTMMGVRGGLLLGRRLGIGGAMYRLTHRFGGGIYDGAGNEYEMRMGYGGLTAQLSILLRPRFELGVEGLFGAGAACIAKQYGRESDCVETVRMFVGEPGVFAYVNLARWMRVGINGGYRFVAREAWSPGNDFRLAGPYFGLNFEFGWFDKRLDR